MLAVARFIKAAEVVSFTGTQRRLLSSTIYDIGITDESHIFSGACVCFGSTF